MSNPYIVGRPIFDPDDFYGRKDDVKYIMSNIENLNPISIVGERGTGRTSLLHYISHPKIVEKNLNLDHYRALYLDFAGFCECTTEEFWGELLNEMEKSSKNPGSASVVSFPGDKKAKIIDIYKSIKNFSSDDVNMVFCFDGFEKVKKNRNFDRNYFDNLRHLVSSFSNVTYVIASKENLGDLQLPEDVLSSPFFTYFTLMRIGFLKQEETKDLILGPSGKMGVQFNEEDVDFVFDVAYCHPYFVQSACREIFRFRSKERRILGEKLKETAYVKIRKSLYQSFVHHFDYYWNLLKNQEKKKFKDLCRSNCRISQSDPLIDILRNLSLIKEENGVYEPFSSLFHRFCGSRKIQIEPFG